MRPERIAEECDVSIDVANGELRNDPCHQSRPVNDAEGIVMLC